MKMLIKNNKVEFNISKREAISNTKKIASLLARTHMPFSKRNELDIDVDNQIVTSMQLLESIVSSLEFVLKCKHRKECLDVLNSEIEKNWKGTSRRLSYE